MNKQLTALVFILCLLQPLLAQKVPGQLGIVGPQELEMQVYDKDPQAEAVVLFDVGETEFVDNEGWYDIRFTRTRRVKILTKAGVQFSEVSIPFYVDGYGKTEYLSSIEAYSYNMENGALVKTAVDKTKIYEEKINDRWRVKKFAFPNVKEGSVLEYKYVLESPFKYNMPDWQFQDKIPTVYSQYSARMIPFYDYVFIAQGISRFDFQESKLHPLERHWGSTAEAYGRQVGRGVKFQDMQHTYVLKDVPAFRDEAYISSPNDYLIKLDFQLAKFKRPDGFTEEIRTTWPALNKDLLKHEKFGKYINSSDKLAKKLLESELKLSQGSELEKAKQIIEYVKANFSWDGDYGKYTGNSPKELLSRKSGSVAEINLFLTAMLQSAGISAHPVILSTRSHGKINTNYPFEHFFNYVVVMVTADQKAFLADGTEEMIAFNKIPPRCINGKGLVVKDGGKEETVVWVDLYSNTQSQEVKTINVKLDPKNLLARVSVMDQSTEFDALHYRNTYRNDTLKIKNELLGKGFRQVSHVKTLNYEKAGLPYTMAYLGEAELEKIDNKLVVSPFFSFPIKENQLTQKKRSYPVDFIYARKETFHTVIDIPAGYKLLAFPEAYQLDNELADISVNYQQVGNTIQANASYHFKKGIYVTEEYARIQYYMDMIVKKFNEQLVFEEM